MVKKLVSKVDPCGVRGEQVGRNSILVYNMSEVGLLLMFRSTEACQFAFMSGCYCLQDMSGSRWLSKGKGKILTR